METVKQYWKKFGIWFSKLDIWGKIVFGMIVISLASGGWGFSLFLIICWFLISKFSKPKIKRLEKEVIEAKAYFAPIIESKKLPIIQVDMNLQKDEHCYYAENNVALAEERSLRVSKGSGASFRVMKGVWVHSYGSKGISVPQLRKVDAGTVFITNNRLVFLGRFSNKSIRLDDILATHQYTDAIELSISSSGKNEYFYVSNPMLIKGMLSIAPYGENLKEVKNIDMQFQIT